MDLKQKLASRYLTAQEALRQDIKEDIATLLSNVKKLSNKSESFSSAVKEVLDSVKKIEDKSIKMKLRKGEYPVGWADLSTFLLSMRRHTHGLDVALKHMNDIEYILSDAEKELKKL